MQCWNTRRPQKAWGPRPFATHYHELTDMEHTLPGVQNYNIAVRTRGDDIIFPAQRSFPVG